MRTVPLSPFSSEPTISAPIAATGINDSQRATTCATYGCANVDVTIASFITPEACLWMQYSEAPQNAPGNECSIKQRCGHAYSGRGKPGYLRDTISAGVID